MNFIRAIFQNYYVNGLQSGMLEQAEDYIKETAPEDKAQHMVDALYAILLDNRIPFSYDNGKHFYFFAVCFLPLRGNIGQQIPVSDPLYCERFRLHFTKKVDNQYYSPLFNCPIDALMWAFDMLSDV
jgi:hypothetical protein